MSIEIFTEHVERSHAGERPHLQPTGEKKFADDDLGMNLQRIAEAFYPCGAAAQSDIQRDLEELRLMLIKIKKRIGLTATDIATQEMFTMASKKLFKLLLVYSDGVRKNPEGFKIAYPVSVEMHQPLTQWLGDRDFFYALYDEGVLQVIINFMKEAVLANVKDYGELTGFDLVSAFVDAAVNSAEVMAEKLMSDKQAAEEVARQAAEEKVQALQSVALCELFEQAELGRACELWRNKVAEAKAEEKTKMARFLSILKVNRKHVVGCIIVLLFLCVVYLSLDLIAALYYFVAEYVAEYTPSINLKTGSDKSDLFRLHIKCSANNQGVTCSYSWEPIGWLHHKSFTPSVIKYDAQRGDDPNADHIKGDISPEKSGDFNIPIDWKKDPENMKIDIALHGKGTFNSHLYRLSKEVNKNVQYKYDEMNPSQQTMEGAVEELTNQNGEMNELVSRANEILKEVNAAKERALETKDRTVVESVYINTKPALNEIMVILKDAESINAAVETNRELITKQNWKNGHLLEKANLALDTVSSSFKNMKECVEQVKQAGRDVFEIHLNSNRNPKKETDGGNPGNPNPDGTPRADSNTDPSAFDDFYEFRKAAADLLYKIHVSVRS